MTTFVDLVAGTTTTTGTGSYAISGSVDGFRPFSVVADSTELTVYVSLGSDYELVTGVVSGTGTTLTRASVIRSSNSDAAVNWGAGTKTMRVVASSAMLTALGEVSTDTTPTLGGNLDADKKQITNAQIVQIAGTSAAYTTSQPNPFLNINGNHSYDYDVTLLGVFTGCVLPSAVEFSGTHTVERDANFLTMGYLFNNIATLTNPTSDARAFASFYTCNANSVILADTTACTQNWQYDYLAQTAFNTQNSGTLTTSRYVNYVADLKIGSGATVTKHVSFQSKATGVTGTCTNSVGFAYDTGASTNNIGYAVGYNDGDTFPSGNWAVYQGNGNTYPWCYNAAQQYKINTSSATSITLDATHHTMKCTSSSPVTVNLPTAVGIAGREYFIKRAGTGLVTVDANGAQTIDGAATYALSTQWDGVRVQSDNANWIVTGVV